MSLTGKRVLVVEDEFLVAMLIEDALTGAGCIVVGPFSRVPEAPVAAKEQAVDVALLDVNVGGEKVFPVAEVLEAKGIPFLFLTGYGALALPKDRPDWEACTKPFNEKDLVTRLERRARRFSRQDRPTP